MAMEFCRDCGKQISSQAATCVNCGAPQNNKQILRGKNQGTAALLAFFLGWLGGHKFYLEKYFVGILYLFITVVNMATLLIYEIDIYISWFITVLVFIDLAVIAYTSPEGWARKYNNGVRQARVHGFIKILAWSPAIAAFFGFLLAIILPTIKQYQSKSQLIENRSIDNGQDRPEAKSPVSSRQVSIRGNLWCRPEACWFNSENESIRFNSNLSESDAEQVHNVCGVELCEIKAVFNDDSEEPTITVLSVRKIP